MACTWAVESVVMAHLTEQIAYLDAIGDRKAHMAVQSIIEDEAHHRDVGQAGDGTNIWLKPIRAMIQLCTEAVIRFGMR